MALLRAIPAPALPGSRPPSAAVEPAAVLARLDLLDASVPRISAALLAYRYCSHACTCSECLQGSSGLKLHPTRPRWNECIPALQVWLCTC